MKETPLKYLRKELDTNNDFLNEWRKLSQKDKDELKDYAIEEINGHNIKDIKDLRLTYIKERKKANDTN
jgi:hypothetical protein